MAKDQAKNTKEVKAKNKKTSASHPTYEEMIKDAITTLKGRTGSSQYAIQKFIEEKQKSLPPTFRKLLLVNLKRLVASEKLVKVKGSFKLPSVKSAAAAPSAPVKKEPAAVTKAKGKVASKAPVKAKPAAKKPAAVAAKPKAKPKAKTKTVAAVSKTRAIAAKPKAEEKADAETAAVATEKAPAKRAFIWTFPYL